MRARPECTSRRFRRSSPFSLRGLAVDVVDDLMDCSLADLAFFSDLRAAALKMGLFDSANRIICPGDGLEFPKQKS